RLHEQRPDILRARDRHHGDDPEYQLAPSGGGRDGVELSIWRHIELPFGQELPRAGAVPAVEGMQRLCHRRKATAVQPPERRGCSPAAFMGESPSPAAFERGVTPRRPASDNIVL